MNQLQEKASAQLFAAFDVRGRAEISRSEWDAWFVQLGAGGDHVAHDPLRDSVRRRCQAPAKEVKPRDDQELDMASMMEQRLGHLRDKMATQLFNVLDTDHNGKVTRAEWTDLFARAAHGREHFALDGFREVLSLTALRKPAVRFLAVFTGDAGSFFEGPRIGDRAPDFTLKRQDSDQRLSLNAYRGDKPLVLIFGNFT